MDPTSNLQPVQPPTSNLQPYNGAMWDAWRSACLRQDLVKHLWAEQAIRSQEVAEAFLVLPREYFLPHLPLEQVYQDEAIVVKRVDGEPRSSSSQPALMADMLEVLELAPGQRVLEIGAGTGYNAALLARLVGPRGRVVSVDIDPEMASAAQTHLAQAGLPEVQVVSGDGAAGWCARAPYDRIVVTVQQYDLSPAWVQQLKEGGLLLVPLTLHEPLRLALIPAFRREGRSLVARSGSLGAFMYMQGQMAHPRLAEPALALTSGPPEEGLVLLAESLQARAFFQALRNSRPGPGRWRPIARERAPAPSDLQHQGGLALLLGMEVGSRAFRLRSGHDRYGFKGYALGLVGPTGRGATVITTSELLHYADAEAAPEARALLDRWHALSCPGQRDFPITAVPTGEQPRPAQAGWSIARTHHTFLIGTPRR
ncbi:MAG: methyltransferase domain-containing protein [Chloroflexi bacterium]|nr:methyltransferase domain-containing protein [Chloroflexota bacterium]